MNYAEFKRKVQALPIIFSRDLLMHKDKKQNIRNQLERWCTKGLLIKLRRGVFMLNPNDRKINTSKLYIANQLYAPSYLSLEYALGFYGLIPERVVSLTSITTKKTMRFQNKAGIFTYQHIKPAAFRGFRAVYDEDGLTYFIAEPEKALVDFLYLNLDRFHENDKDVFGGSYRLQNTEKLKEKKIKSYAKFFNTAKLMRVCKTLCLFLREENAE